VRTYESTMAEVQNLEAEQRKITSKLAPSADDKAELMRLEGAIEALRTIADEQHDKETQELREAAARAVPIGETASRSGEIWRDRQGREVRCLAPEDKLAASDSGLSLGRAVRAMALGTWQGAEEEYRALGESLGTAGGYLVPAPLSNRVIDAARAASVCIRAGVRTIPFADEGGKTFEIAKVTADPSVAWVGEAGTITPSDPTFGAVVFTANKLVAIIRASRELLEDAPNAAEVIERTIALAMAAEIDRACLEGSGAGAEPTGLQIMADVNEVKMDTNGAIPTNGSSGVSGPAKLLETYAEVTGANFEPTAMISSPRTFAAFAGLVDDTYQPLNLPAPIAALPWLRTTNVSDTAECGSSGAVASSLYMADFTKGMLGVRSEIEIYQSRDVYLTSDETAFLVAWRGDFQVENPAAFGRLLGILDS